MEPTEENLRAWNEFHRRRVPAEPIPGPVRRLLPDLAGKHVLHLMCGGGEATQELVALGALVTALDLSPELLALARRRAETAVLLRADPNQLPAELQRGRLDFVYGDVGLLVWLQDLDAFFGQAWRALRPSGELLLHDTHPVALCLDLPSLRWRYDYFGGGVRRLGDVVGAVARTGFVVRALEELPSLARRAPGEFALLAARA